MNKTAGKVEGSLRCVLLADRHHGLTEGVRGLLSTSFDSVVMVADEGSLFAAATRLEPDVVVVDLSLAHHDGLRWVKRLRDCYPSMKVILLSVHEEASVRDSALRAGADGFVLKHAIATDLLPAVDAVVRGQRYVSQALGGNRGGKPGKGNR